MTNFEYEGEVWGKFLELITFNEKEKESINLINAIFDAAKKDFIEEMQDKKNPRTSKTVFSDVNYKNGLMYVKRKLRDGYNLDNEKNTHLNKLIDEICNSATFENSEEVDNKKKQLKEELQKNLKEPYLKLKDTLGEVRIMGVNKNNTEKLKTMAEICKKTLGVIIIAIGSAALVFAGALAVALCGPSPVSIGMSIYAGGLAAGAVSTASLLFASDSIELNKIRSDMKDIITTAKNEQNVIPSKINHKKHQSR